MLQNENLKIYLYIEGAHYANYRLRALLFKKSNKKYSTGRAMAIFHCSIKNFNRRSGAGNICSAAAYRSGERLKSIDDDKIKYPHRSKNDIEYSGLLNNLTNHDRNSGTK